MTAPQTTATSDPQSTIAALQQRLDAGLAREAALAEELTARTAELAERKSEFDERIEYQSATIDVLKAMSATPSDPQPVFDLIVRRTARLCNGSGAGLLEFDGELVHYRSSYGLDPAATRTYAAIFPMAPTRRSIACRAILDKQIIHIRDMDAEPGLLQVVRNFGTMSNIALPLMRDGAVIGVLVLDANERGGFSENQVALLQTFAEQAVIAITSAETYRALQTRTSDLQETLEYQTAVSDVLKVISRSTFDLQPVLDTVVETAVRLCDADYGLITRRDGTVFRCVATYSAAPEFVAWARDAEIPVHDRGSLTGRTVLDEHVVHIEDVTIDPDYTFNDALRFGQPRTALGVPLMRNGIVTGTINVVRRRVARFTDKQIALVATFADQAVIAIENTRLITGQREALAQQTATAEVLQLINSSPDDLAPVFDAILEKAHSLCGAPLGSLVLWDGDQLRAVATRGYPQEYETLARQGFPPTGSFRLLLSGEPFRHVLDSSQPPTALDNHPMRRAAAEIAGVRTVLFVPLRKDETVLGYISAQRQEVRPFTDKQIALLENFAAQAVIAMENARLLTETREALEQQTATAEVLQVINASPGNLTPVFDTILEKAMRLCEAPFGVLVTYDGECFPTVAMRGVATGLADAIREPVRPSPGMAYDQIARGADIVHIADITDDDVYRSGNRIRRALADQGGARTALFVALRGDDALFGVFVIYRKEVRPFSDKQIALLQNFAAQAVIAMENARLLDEVRQRQEELRVTFENMGDGVAMFDETPRLVAWNHKFQEIFDVPDALLAEQRPYADYIRYLAERGDYGPGTDVEEQVRRITENASQHRTYERTRPDGRVIEIRNNPVAGRGFVLIFSDITERKQNEAEIRAARDAAEEASRTIEAAYRDLKAAQASLIQAEKMASLGQLTAGIAHEIKNPLNFVNNFSDLSVDLLNELQEAVAPGKMAVADDRRAEIEDITTTLKGNLEKIAEHGRRADSIVKNMLLHSRTGPSEHRAIDVNTTVDEALNLAYHGARAETPGFNITMEKDLDPKAGSIDAFPQEFLRVMLNLINNGFYAARKRANAIEDKSFEPTLHVATRDLGSQVEIRVRDNGTGINDEVRDKIFEPFFTTKPAGEGTGLGLSLSYDIIVKQHGGQLTVDSRPNDFTEFQITLPRRMATNEGGRA